MPIRMEQDEPQQPSSNRNNQNKPGGGGLGNLIKYLPIVLLFVFKKPKLLIPVLIVAAVWYFFFGGQEMLSGGLAQETEEVSDLFSFGASLDEEVYDKALVFEPISYGYGGQSALPASASLQRFAPTRRHQGRQGSCVGWASAYGARTILEAETSGKKPDDVAFSPAYLYNQIALTGCQGAYMVNAMEAMQNYGGLPFNQFRYDERTCSNEPTSNQKKAGQQFRIKGFNRLTIGAGDYKPDMVAIKQHLAQGYPVVIGMMVGGTFMSEMVRQSAWTPTQRDYGMRGFSGHAMCVIGYDDNKSGGSFQIMNSWGEDWGSQGIAWVRYRDFEYFVKEAYGVYPMASAQNQDKMAVEFGLLDINTRNTIGLQKSNNLEFKTIKPIKKGDKFKVIIANSVECYTYVFGQETDGSSYILFPYTEKHDPYCGITGTRVFPKDYSMVADEIGNKDFIAMVFSKEPLNFNDLNSRINKASGNNYAQKVKAALGSDLVEEVNFQASNTVAFEANTKGKKAVAMVIAIDKQ